MNKKERAYYILEKMEGLFPDASTELANWQTPFQFLIAIILSAQTMDAKVNQVTSQLFKKYPTSSRLAKANRSDVEGLLNGINYYINKAKYIIETAKVIEEKYAGKAPESVKELVALPGVGQKTANVFLNELYQKNEGIGADTHIMRVSQRLGLTKNTSPTEIAKDLQKIYKQKDWSRVNSVFVLYGRYYCKAYIKGKSKCVFKEFCSYCKDK